MLDLYFADVRIIRRDAQVRRFQDQLDCVLLISIELGE
jgi:hypothetical protein